MAEFVLKELLRRAEIDDVEVESAAMHTDEIGSDVHFATREMLRRADIPFSSRAAWLLTASKAEAYDLIIGMDSYNIADLRRLVSREDHSKIHRLLEFAGSDADVADPWYTGDFESTLRDVMAGCRGLVAELLKRRRNS